MLEPYKLPSRAGSGRTGAFMAVWQLMDAIDNGLQPSVQEVVQRLRDQRPHMVNTIVSLKGRAVPDKIGYFYN